MTDERSLLKRELPRLRDGDCNPCNASHVGLQMVELKRVIDEDQRTYVQWAEEKLSLANIAADLLIQHRTAVDKDVGALLAELKVAIFSEPKPLSSE